MRTWLAQLCPPWWVLQVLPGLQAQLEEEEKRLRWGGVRGAGVPHCICCVDEAGCQSQCCAPCALPWAALHSSRLRLRPNGTPPAASVPLAPCRAAERVQKKLGTAAPPEAPRAGGLHSTRSRQRRRSCVRLHPGCAGRATVHFSSGRCHIGDYRRRRRARCGWGAQGCRDPPCGWSAAHGPSLPQVCRLLCG